MRSGLQKPSAGSINQPGTCEYTFTLVLLRNTPRQMRWTSPKAGSLSPNYAKKLISVTSNGKTTTAARKNQEPLYSWQNVSTLVFDLCKTLLKHRSSSLARHIDAKAVLTGKTCAAEPSGLLSHLSLVANPVHKHPAGQQA